MPGNETVVCNVKLVAGGTDGNIASAAQLGVEQGAQGVPNGDGIGDNSERLAVTVMLDQHAALPDVDVAISNQKTMLFNRLRGSLVVRPRGGGFGGNVDGLGQPLDCRRQPFLEIVGARDV